MAEFHRVWAAGHGLSKHVGRGTRFEDAMRCRLNILPFKRVVAILEEARLNLEPG